MLRHASGCEEGVEVGGGEHDMLADLEVLDAALSRQPADDGTPALRYAAAALTSSNPDPG